MIAVSHGSTMGPVSVCLLLCLFVCLRLPCTALPLPSLLRLPVSLLQFVRFFLKVCVSVCCVCCVLRVLRVCRACAVRVCRVCAVCCVLRAACCVLCAVCCELCVCCVRARACWASCFCRGCVRRAEWLVRSGAALKCPPGGALSSSQTPLLRGGQCLEGPSSP